MRSDPLQRVPEAEERYLSELHRRVLELMLLGGRGVVAKDLRVSAQTTYNCWRQGAIETDADLFNLARPIAVVDPRLTMNLDFGHDRVRTPPTSSVT